MVPPRHALRCMTAELSFNHAFGTSPVPHIPVVRPCHSLWVRKTVPFCDANCTKQRGLGSFSVSENTGSHFHPLLPAQMGVPYSACGRSCLEKYLNRAVLHIFDCKMVPCGDSWKMRCRSTTRAPDRTNTVRQGDISCCHIGQCPDSYEALLDFPAGEFRAKRGCLSRSGHLLSVTFN